jgi:hypothetical protein
LLVLQSTPYFICLFIVCLFHLQAFVDLVARAQRADVIMTHDEHARRDVTGQLSMHVFCTHKAVKLVLRYFKVLLLFDTY